MVGSRKLRKSKKSLVSSHLFCDGSHSPRFLRVRVTFEV